ncbi:MAG: BTAD domain-containing putative transcriptional regulator [Leptothrix sp. (in: b-proteobacteria)]
MHTIAIAPTPVGEPSLFSPERPAWPQPDPAQALAPRSDAPVLVVRLLDGFQVWLDGEPVHDLPHGKPRNLLMLLLLQRRRPQPRARLCSQLWPEAEAGSARNSLNVALHRLRRTLGHGDLIRHGTAGYQLVCEGGVWLDVEQFLLHAEMGQLEDSSAQAAHPADAPAAPTAPSASTPNASNAHAISQYEAALALYRTDLFSEGEEPAALALDAQALRDRCNQVLDRLAALREQAGDWHGCLRVALRHLSVDECNEAAHRRLMRCYASLGQVQLADKQYRSCVAQLRVHMGLAPMAETVQLYRRITSRPAG